MQIINKDITTIESGTIVHQVNCQGVMGSGVALAIKNKWPQVYASYLEFYKYEVEVNERDLLGRIDICPINEELSVVNLFGQLDYRSALGSTTKFTSYGAWEKGLENLLVAKIYDKISGPIYMPYLIGCDRGGGNWEILSRMIDDVFPNVIFCKLP